MGSFYTAICLGVSKVAICWVFLSSWKLADLLSSKVVDDSNCVREIVCVVKNGRAIG